jgi:hypothetical protein
MRETPFSSRFRLAGVELGGLLGDEVARRLRAVRRAEELVDRAEVDRQREDLAAVLRVDAVHVGREVREAVDVLPDRLVGGVEQVRPVAVHLDAGLRVLLAVRVAADVVAAIDDEDLEAQLLGDALRDRESEETGSDHYEIRAHGTFLCWGGARRALEGTGQG